MPKRFSGDVRLTVYHRDGDGYDIRVKSPGFEIYEGATTLELGYVGLHGQEKSMDEAARRHLSWIESEPNLSKLVKNAAKDGNSFHIGREKADRWPGGPSNKKTKKGR